MIFLRPIVAKINPAMIDELEHLKDDRELMDALQQRGVSRREIVKALESYYGMSSVDLLEIKMDSNVLQSFDLDEWRKIGVLPYAVDPKSKTCSFAVPDVGNQELRETLTMMCKQSGYVPRVAFALPHEIQAKFAEWQAIVKAQREAEEETDMDIVGWVNELLAKGIRVGASDIHIEPQEVGLQVRFRVDGLLAIKDEYSFSSGVIHKIVSRIKIMSNMDIAEKRRPQNGRIDGFAYGPEQYEMRISSIPTIHGEKLVLRIFNKMQSVASFDELGFTPEEQDKLNQILSNNCGIACLSGATGVGKTTTLYAMINVINTDHINICTIEDPVEKSVKNINQIPVNAAAGVTYASVLKALLRQDPDVIVVGEVRDQETAELSVRAALTGHLVLTTIHANSALETLDRLYDMGVEPFLLGGSVVGIIAQRLARVLCPHCKVVRPLSGYEREWVKSMARKWPELVKVEGLDSFYTARGCSHCNDIGYRGRTVIAEILVANSAVREVIVERKGRKELLQVALEYGYVPLEVSAFRRVKNGITSVAEVIRVLK